MAAIGTIRRFPIALRLSGIPRREDGRIRKEEKVTTMDALLRSLIDIGWNQQAESCVNPLVRFRVEPRRLLCDLIAEQEEVAKAALWKNQVFDSQKFRDSVVRGLAKAIAAWEQGKFDQAFIADATGIRIMGTEAANDVRPGR